MKRKSIIALSVVLALSASWCIFAPRLSWDGVVVGRILVTVVDERRLTPIADAAVELRYPRKDEASPTFSPDFYDKLITESATDKSGMARITSYFGAGGSTGVFGRSGRVVYRNIWVQVSADGYETARTRLSQFTGETRSVRRNQTTAFTIKLAVVSERTVTQRDDMGRGPLSFRSH